jgi:hypothetical protein
MWPKLFALSLSATLVAQTGSNDYLRDRALKAKASGDTKLEIYERSNDDGARDTLAKIASLLDVVVAVPIASYTSRNSTGIST